MSENICTKVDVNVETKLATCKSEQEKEGQVSRIKSVKQGNSAIRDSCTAAVDSKIRVLDGHSLSYRELNSISERIKVQKLHTPVPVGMFGKQHEMPLFLYSDFLRTALSSGSSHTHTPSALAILK